MKKVAMILLATAMSLIAKDFKMAIQFSLKLQMDGHRHNNMATFHHDGRRIICHYRPLTIQERKWIADNVINSYPAMYSESAYIDGIGKILMLAREEIYAYDETCVRGIVYLVHDNGKWEQGVSSQRTLGWGDSDSKIWGGYAFVHAKEENIKKQENKTMGEPKFTKNMKPFCDKQADGKFNIGIEDSEKTVLCYTASGNPETRRANVTLWSKSDELYKMLEKLLIAAKTANEMNPVKIHQGLLRDVEETLKEARRE